MNSTESSRTIAALEKLGIPATRITYAGGTFGVELGSLDESHVVACERIAPMLELLRRLRGESLFETDGGVRDPIAALQRANAADVDRQRRQVWTVRLIVDRPKRLVPKLGVPPTLDELVANDAIRILSPAAGNADSADVLELAPPAHVADSHEWAHLTATKLHDLGFNAAAAPAWNVKETA